jgi:hypothetical protein
MIAGIMLMVSRSQRATLARFSVVPAAFLTILFTCSLQAQQFSPAIEDNSYFVEEAYNQEDTVVQHISTGYYQKSTETFVYTFTQEWPIGGQGNQLSYTIPYQTMAGGIRGFGDVMLNYRYQLTAGEAWCWIAPRFSLILPTGKSGDGLGNGVVGMQINIPVSKRWSNLFITHVNAGMTLLPGVTGTSAAGEDVKRTLPTYFAGVSGILLLTENFNLMGEILESSMGDFDENGDVTFSSQTILSPGLRWAINLGDLQIVPGAAFPVVVQGGTSEVTYFGYLSFEHPF